MDERRVAPELKTYLEYTRNGRMAERTGEPVNGVKGVWLLHELPYAKKIHWTKDSMHTFDNIIRDTIHLFKRTEGSHMNRTTSEKVVSACQENRIFASAYGADYDETPPWILNSANSALHDSKLKNVLGALKSEIPSNVMQYGRVGSSHSSIQYAINGWATWSLYNENEDESHTFPYTEIKIKLFNMLGKLSAGRILKSSLQLLETELINILVEHSSMFPPTEQTYTLHELVHILKQIPIVGPPRYSTLFKFERVNLFLKRMVKNRNYSLASITKNYLVSK